MNIFYCFHSDIINFISICELSLDIIRTCWCWTLRGFREICPFLSEFQPHTVRKGVNQEQTLAGSFPCDERQLNGTIERVCLGHTLVIGEEEMI